MADLALEYQLTRPGEGRAHLLDLLAPLAGTPDLLETLDVYVGHDANRRLTARDLACRLNARSPGHRHSRTLTLHSA